MPRKNSLTHAEIANLPRGKRFEGGFFSFTVAKAPGKTSKCACVVSKKVALRANDRNLIKRRCREALWPFITKFNPPLIIVAHARKQAAGATFALIREDVERLIQSCQ